MVQQLNSLKYEAGLDASKFVQGAEQLSNAAGKAGGAASGLGDAVEQTERKVIESSSAIGRLKNALDPLAAATAKAEREQRTWDRALERGRVSQEQYEAGLERLRLRYEQAALAAAKAERAQRAAAASGNSAGLIGANGQVDIAAYQKLVAAQDNAAGSQERLSKSSSRMNQALAQSGAQISDVAAQVAAGGNAFAAFGMQLGQLLQVFGPMGAIIGAGITLLGMWAGKAMEAGDGAKSAAKAVEEYKDALELSHAVQETADQTQKRLNQSRREAAIATLEAAAAVDKLSMAELERRRQMYQGNIAEAGRNTGGVFGIKPEEAKGLITGINADLAEVQKAIDKLNARVSERDAALERLRNPSAQYSDPGGYREAEQARKDQERERERQEKEMQTEAERREKVISKLQAETDAHRRINEAKGDGIAIQEEVNRQLAEEAAVRELGAGASAEQIAQVRELARQNYDYEKSIAAKKEADQKAKESTKASLAEQEREYKDFHKDVARVAQDISKDWATGIYESMMDGGGAEKVLDWFKNLFKRIAVAAIQNAVVLPVVTQLVGSMPGMFGITAPAGGVPGAGAPGAAGQASGGSLLNSAGSIGSALSGTGGFSGMAASANAWGASTFGFSSGAAVAPSAAFVGPMPLAGAGEASVAGSSGMLGGTTMMGAVGGGLAGVGVGGMVGSMVGNATQSKAAGAASGALSGAAMGAMMGGPWGAAIGFVGGALMGALGTASKPSNMEGNSTFDLSTGRQVAGGQEGKKFSKENREAAGNTALALGGLGQLLAEYSGTELSGGLKVAVGNRDGVSASYGGASQNFKRDEAGIADMAKFVVGQFSSSLGGKLPGEIATALGHVDWKDLEAAVKDIKFAGDFRDSLKALSGDFGVVDEAVKKAKDEVKQLTSQIGDFNATTARLGLDTAAAATATKQFVEGVIGLRDTAPALSETAAAVKVLEARFEAIGPLLAEVGISAGEAAAGLRRAIGKLAEAMNEQIGRGIAAITGDPSFAWNDLLEQQRQRLNDATLIGADIVQVERLAALERQSFLENLSAAQRAMMGNLGDAAADAALQASRLKAELMEAISSQIDLAQDAAAAARRAAEAFKQLARSIADAIAELRGGDLSTLSPEQKLAEQRARFSTTAAAAGRGDQAALAALPDIAQDFLEASRGYYASGTAYAQDFNEVMRQLSDAQAAAEIYGKAADQEATLLDESVRLLGLINDAIASGNTEAVAQHMEELNNINGLISNLRAAVVSGNRDAIGQQTEELGALTAILSQQSGTIAAGNTNLGALLTSGNDRIAALLSSFLQLSQAQREEEARRAEEAKRIALEQAEAARRAAEAQAQAAAAAAAEAQRRAAEAAKANSTGARAASLTAGQIGGASNADFIGNMFREVMGREASGADMSWHLNILNQTGNRDRLLMYFRQNAEATAYLEGLRNQVRGLGGVPQFATGGEHMGGLRIVGERGPELEATGRARIYSAQQTRALLQANDSGSVEELRQLRQDLRALIKVTAAAGDLNNEALGKLDQRLASVERRARLEAAA